MTKGIVLIADAWMGAWAWQDVVLHLQERGHEVYPVTLSGLAGGNTGPATSEIGLSTHVDDVLSSLKAEKLHDVLLVAHGYGGIVAGLVADRAPERVTGIVFVEAFLPHHGRSFLDAFPEQVRAAELRLISENGGRWPPPALSEVSEGQDLTPAQAQWLVERFVPHPGRSVSESVELNGSLAELPVNYVICAKDHVNGWVAADVEARRREPNWSFHTLDTGHWPMVSAPGELAAIIDGVAAEEIISSSRLWHAVPPENG